MSDEEKYWTIVKTRVHQELRALVHLRNQNIEAFMPFRNFEVRQARKTKKKKKAIFPGYIFVKLQERNFGKLNSTRGISYVLIGMEGRPAILSDQFMVEFLKNFEDDGSVKADLTIVKGDSVRIANGPLSGLIGTVEELEESNRISVILKVAEKFIRCSTNLLMLEKLNSV